jgi:hypothetical protein
LRRRCRRKIEPLSSARLVSAMITFNVKGRLVSVLCPEFDDVPGEVELSVVLEREDGPGAMQILAAEGVPGHRLWLVHLPPELSEGRPRHIGVEIRSGARLLESADSWL